MFRWIFILCGFILFSQQVGASVPSTNKSVVDAIMHPYLKQNNIPGAAVLLYVNGKPETYYFGDANKTKHIPVTKDTIFEIGSISKVMTSVLLAEAVDAAKMQLNDSVTDFIATLPNSLEDISLLNLATHTSGLPFEAPGIKTEAQLNDYFQHWQGTHQTDAVWIYSNVGMGLLGRAVSKAMHQNLDALYQTQLFSPLKMTASGLTIKTSQRKNLAQGYDKNLQPAAPVTLGLFPAAGSLKASAADMQRFLAAAIGLTGTPEHIFYPMRMTQSAFVEMDGWQQGLGWQLYSLESDQIDALLHTPPMKFGPLTVKKFYEVPKFDGDLLMDKTGLTDGFRVYIAVIPNKQAGIAILTNRYAEDSEIVNVGRKILFDLTGIEKNIDTDSTES